MKKLRNLIDRHVEAQIADSWSGTEDAEGQLGIKLRAERAERKLNKYLQEVECTLKDLFVKLGVKT